ARARHVGEQPQDGRAQVVDRRAGAERSEGTAERCLEPARRTTVRGEARRVEWLDGRGAPLRVTHVSPSSGEGLAGRRGPRPGAAHGRPPPGEWLDGPAPPPAVEVPGTPATREWLNGPGAGGWQNRLPPRLVGTGRVGLPWRALAGRPPHTPDRDVR